MRDAVVAVMSALAEQAARGAIPGHRDEQADVCPVRVGGQGREGCVRVLGKVLLGLRGDHEPLDGKCTPDHRIGPGDAPQQVLDALVVGQILLLDRGESLRAQVRRRQGGDRAGFGGEQVCGGHEGEKSGRLVPSRSGDETLGVQGDEVEWVGHGAKGWAHQLIVPHALMLPYVLIVPHAAGHSSAGALGSVRLGARRDRLRPRPTDEGTGTAVSHPDWFDEEPTEGNRPRPDAPAQPAGQRSAIGPTLVVIVLLIILGSASASWVTDLWWYDSVGFRGVFLTEWGTKALLFVLGFLIVGGVLAANVVVAYRTRPFVIPTTPGQQALEQYRQLLHPLRRVALIAVPSVMGVLAGMGTAGAWQTYLLWRNAVPFGTKDPQFGLDVGFFVFTMPWLTFLLNFAMLLLVLSLAAAIFVHYLYGGLQLPGRGPSTRAAYAHIGILGALLAIVRGGSYWLDRYALSWTDGSLITGFTYTGANAVLPTRAILAVSAVMIAGLFLASIWTLSWRLPIIGAALLIITAVLMGGIYPALVQSLKVKPSEQSLEAPFIARNIAATRDAYGLSDIETTAYPATTDTAPGQLRHDAETIPGIRLIDPNVVTPTFRQLEGLRQYYAFPDILDVDRYDIDGTTSDSVVAVREMNLEGVPSGQRNWVNDHTVYTHGFGFVAAYGNQHTREGDPVFFTGGFTDSGKLPAY